VPFSTARSVCRRSPAAADTAALLLLGLDLVAVKPAVALRLRGTAVLLRLVQRQAAQDGAGAAIGAEADDLVPKPPRWQGS